MTLPKKGIKKITVNNVKYGWRVKGTDEGLSLSIVPIEKQDNLLIARFSYRLKDIEVNTLANGMAIRQQLQLPVVSGYVIRQVITLALEAGWNPMGEKAIINLHNIDDKVKCIERPSWLSLP